MKTKSIFGIEHSISKALGFAEKNLRTFSERLGNKLDKWLGNTSRTQRKKRRGHSKKQRKIHLELITEQHQGLLEMNEAKSKAQINTRFFELEQQQQEQGIEKEASIDAGIER